MLTRAPGYVLSLDRDQLDLQRFERLVREAAASDPPAAAEKLREALALWRGPPLADLAYEPFAQAAIGRLEELRLGAIEKRIDADLAVGRHGELIVELEELVAEHPLREHLRAQLMLALYRCGRQADALEVYRRTREGLSAELGLEPGRELKELENAILNQDPSLDPLSPATEVASGESAPDRKQAVELQAPRRTRKVVTVLFCDVTGSTALGEELDPEALFGVMSRYVEELRAIIERHGGTVAKLIGDAVMAVFGVPRVHEEDALRAVRAAAEIRTRLPALAQEVGVELRFRTGVNTGLVFVGEGENLAVGDAVSVAARLEQAAQPGEILLGEATHRLVRDAVEVEPLEALLAARLERLAGEEQEVLECGAVEGEVFHRGLARPLAGGERSDAEIDELLAGLVRKDLIRPHAATLPDDRAFRFRHLLIRDAAYDSLPKAARAELHERLARALEVAAPDLIGLDEIAGWHLEQAIACRRELGRDVSGELTEAASEHLHTAGLRARERSDVMAATNLLERARLLAPEADIRRVRIGLDLAEQLIDAGDVDPVDELLTEAQRHPEADALTALTRLELMTHSRPPGATRAIESQLPGMLEHFARVGDERALARTHILACDLYWMKARATPAAEELRLAAEHARKAKDEGLRERALASYVATLRYSSLDAPTISERLDAIERERLGPYLAAAVEMGRSAVAGLEGRADEARRLVHCAADRFRSLGNSKTVAGIEQDIGHLELSLGDPGAALEALERSDAILARLGERSSRSTTQAFIAQAHWRLGSVDAARAALELAEELGGTDDVGTMIETHRVRAQMALAGGDGEAAERWARSAVDQAFATDALVDQADSKLALARVLAGLGRPQDAVAEARAALELFLTRGDRPGADQTRAVLNELRGRE